MDLHREWARLALAYTSHEAVADRLWQELEACYSSRGRHYHTLGHLAYMLQLADRHTGAIEAPAVLRLAVFYHDIVYKPLRHDNEEKSAALAAHRLRELGVPEPAIARVARHIMATRAHGRSPDADTNLLTDLDLAVLGDAPDRYHAYALQVRKEYGLVPDFLYRRGRTKVLRHLLALPEIFKTEAFFAEREAQARANLQQELTYWQSTSRR